MKAWIECNECSATESCPNCIDTERPGLVPINLESTDGEFWGEFCDSAQLDQGRRTPDGGYNGAWYWEYFVYFPNAYAVNHTLGQRVRIVEGPFQSEVTP